MAAVLAPGYSKRCTQCQRGLSIESFYVKRDTADGHDHRCKRCCVNNAMARKKTGAYLTARRREYERTGRCPECEDMSWRRKRPACPCCGKMYAREDVTEAWDEIRERRKVVYWL